MHGFFCAERLLPVLGELYVFLNGVHGKLDGQGGRQMVTEKTLTSRLVRGTPPDCLGLPPGAVANFRWTPFSGLRRPPGGTAQFLRSILGGSAVFLPELGCDDCIGLAALVF